MQVAFHSFNVILSESGVLSARSLRALGWEAFAERAVAVSAVSLSQESR
jgi:hypothetical protein